MAIEVVPSRGSTAMSTLGSNVPLPMCSPQYSMGACSRHDLVLQTATLHGYQQGECTCVADGNTAWEPAAVMHQVLQTTAQHVRWQE